MVLRNYLTITTGPLVLKGWESPPLEYLRSVFHLAVTAAQGDLVLVCLSVKSIIRYPTCCLRAHLSLVGACIVFWIPMAFRNNTWRLFSQDYILCCNRSNRYVSCVLITATNKHQAQWLKVNAVYKLCLKTASINVLVWVKAMRKCECSIETQTRDSGARDAPKSH